jgi:hypothetical protein
MSKKEIEEIVERDAPWLEPAERPEGQDVSLTKVEPEDVGPGIDELRKKYLGDSGSSDAGENDSLEPDPSKPRAGEDNPGHGDVDADELEDEIVAVRPKEAMDPWSHGARPKNVVISGKTRRIIGSQG